MNRIIYLHIENFLDFSEPVSLNLSNEFHCQVVDNMVYVHGRRNLFRQVLGKTVMDINVIAGENGVGKTQLLKTLAEIACGSTTMDYLSDYDYVLIHQNSPGELTISSNIDIEYNPEPLEGFTMSEKGDIVSPVIYYSPFLDFNPLDINTRDKRKPIIDISMSHFVMDDTDQKQKKMDIIPPILTMKANNILRQIDFVTQKPLEVEMPFKLPGELFVRFNRLTVNQDDVSIDDRDIFGKLTAYSATFFRDADSNGISQMEMAKIMFYRNLLSLFFLSVNNDKSQSILHHSFGNGLVSEIDAFEGEDPLALIDLYQRFFATEDIFRDRIFERLTNIAFSIIESEGTSISFNSGNNHLTLSVAPSDQRISVLLREMQELEETETNKFVAKELIHFISFDWRNFSSGEKSFLDLCSRLYLAKKKLVTTADTVLLLLDEAEIGFHPEWQKRFVYFLIGFLNSVFPSHSLQVVLATHSPLVLSDFPTERVHLFRRHDGIVVNGIGFGTFAQNIPDLLARDFFIDTTLIGDLSKRFIDDILADINNGDASDVMANFNSILERIGKIDEPVIKGLLLNALEGRLDAEN